MTVAIQQSSNTGEDYCIGPGGQRDQRKGECKNVINWCFLRNVGILSYASLIKFQWQDTHLGVTKTKDRILQRYYWPGVFQDVANYCRSCELRQRSTPRRPMRAEMIPLPLVTHPFEWMAMDLVGPLPT